MRYSMAIDIMIGNRVGCSKSSGGMVLKDGVFLYPTVITGDERRYRVEVWKDNKMLFPEYDGEIGQKNLLLNTKRAVASDSYLLTTYPLQDKTLEEGEPVSIILSGVLGQGKSHFTAYNSGSSAAIAGLTTIVGNTYSRSTTWKKTRSDGIIVHNSSLWVYHMLNSVTGVTSSIDWIKLVRGSVIPEVWTPAPEELLELAKITTTNCSYKIDGDELVLYSFTDNNGTVNIEVSYGDDWVRSKSTTWTANFSSRSLEIFKYASSNGYVLPTKQVAYDEYIRGLINSGLFDKLDLHYIFSGDGDINFKLINVINPGIYNGTAFGGLEWSAEGVKGNGVNGYVDTNFNPALLVEGQRYQLNDASRGIVICEESTLGSIQGVYDSNRSNHFNILQRSTSNIQRINSSALMDSGLNMHGVGLKTINRISDISIFLTNKIEKFDRTQQSGLLTETSQTILARLDGFGLSGVSSYHLGASLTYEETQIFRELFNKYLKSNNLQEIA